jgi:mannose/fructose/N-acetylgalactosamine-specific phosphotransferase system component IIB
MEPHNSKLRFKNNVKIDNENKKIFNAIQKKRSSIDFKKFEKDFEETQRLRNNLLLLP